VPIEPWQVMADALLAWAPRATAGLTLELVDDVLRCGPERLPVHR